MSKIMTAHERLLALALRLPLDERTLLAEKIWDSLPEEIRSADLTEEEKAELDRRIAEMEANPDAGSSWEEVRARLRKDR